jgi:hypothetical protein
LDFKRVWPSRRGEEELVRGILAWLNFLYRFRFEEVGEVAEKRDVGVRIDEGEAENEEGGVVAEKDPGEAENKEGGGVTAEAEVMKHGVMVAVFDMDFDVKEEVEANDRLGNFFFSEHTMLSLLRK